MNIRQTLPGTPVASSDQLARLVAAPGRAERIRHVHTVPARPGVQSDWPAWVPPDLTSALQRRGIQKPWQHQSTAADLAWAGQSVVVATGTGSGKSLAFQLPAFSALLQPAAASSGGLRGSSPTVLYLAPTKALAADQLRSLRSLKLPVHVATLDGDTPNQERSITRNAATYVLSNPDMLHASLLPSHGRWADFLRRLHYVVIDECHAYRGVFGSHVAAVLRRLRRLCAHYGSEPAFLLASATVAEPEVSAQRLTGVPIVPVTADASPRGSTSFVLWEPPLVDQGWARASTSTDEATAPPVRRTVTAEAADLLADLVSDNARAVAFVRSRRAAESVASSVRRLLAEVEPGLQNRVAAYRAGYLSDERRSVEHALGSGDLLGLASTNALELGVDVAGLDAVIIAGWPGTRASLWQQAGRAGRAGRDSLAVLLARDEPLDTYLVHHPEAIFGRPVEAQVFDPDNPYVLAPHLCAAAAELPLREADLELFGPNSPAVVEVLTREGALRRRAAGWFWTRRERACGLADLRGSGGPAVRIVEEATGRLLGTVDSGSAHGSVHAGAVYVHQGESYLVCTLSLEDSVAVVRRAEPDYTTSASEITDIRVLDTVQQRGWGAAELSLGNVEVTSQVVSYFRKRIMTGEILGEYLLDLPERRLRTRAVWWSVSDQQVRASGLAPADVPGAAHAAEHASIGLLPLFATCDRWDIGGVSTARHPDTGRLTVFVYDGHAGGAGFAERGFAAAAEWLRATRAAIGACECGHGCPSCVQSPKCGNGNEPLSKSGAVQLLDILLAGAPS